MLISRRDDRLQLVTQPDHAALAGQLAARWGNERFGTPANGPSLTVAAARHDDGWSQIDGGPAVLASEGRPAHFLEVELPDTVGPYGDGVEGIYADDVYAGLLTSRHWAGLYSSRWGVQDSPPVGHPAAQDVVAEQEERIARELRGLWAADTGQLRSAFEAGVWRDYEILQALDFLSLAICLIDLATPTAATNAPPIPVPATLRELDQPPGPRLIPNVPAARAHVTITLTVAEPGVVALDPYPLAAPAVTCDLLARHLPDIRHPDPARAYHQAAPQTATVTVVER